MLSAVWGDCYLYFPAFFLSGTAYLQLSFKDFINFSQAEEIAEFKNPVAISDTNFSKLISSSEKKMNMALANAYTITVFIFKRKHA